MKIKLIVYFLLFNIQNICLYSHDTFYNVNYYNIPVQTHDSLFHLSAQNYALVYFDTTKSKGFKEIIQIFQNGKFQNPSEISLPTRFTSSKFFTWIYFEINNEKPYVQKIILTRAIENDSIFILKDDRETGYHIKYFLTPALHPEEKISLYNKFIIDVKPHETKKVFIKKQGSLFNASNMFPLVSDFNKFKSHGVRYSNPLVNLYTILLSFFSCIAFLIFTHFLFFKKTPSLYYFLFLLVIIISTYRGMEDIHVFTNLTVSVIPWFRTKLAIALLIFYLYSLFVFSLIESEGINLKFYKKAILVFMLASIGLDIPLQIFSPAYSFTLYSFCRVFAVVFGIIFIILHWRKVNLLIRFIFFSTFIIIGGEIVSFFLSGYYTTIVPMTAVAVKILMLTIIYSIWIYREYSGHLQLLLEKENKIIENNEKLAEIRREMSRDIHDDVGSAVTKLMLDAYYFNSSPSSDKQEIKGKILNNLEKIRYALKEMDFLYQDKPTTISTLFSEIRLLVNEIFLNSTIENIHFNFHEQEKNLIIPFNIRKQLLSAVKEITTNILKHSKANTVSVQSFISDNILSIQIENNNNKYKNVNPVTSSGQGLKNIKSRIQKAGGQLTISENSDFWTVSIELPLRAESI